MSDDLVRRLRDLAYEWTECCGDIHLPLSEAADRIEVFEAKLAKSVEALVRIEDLTQHNMPMTAREEQCVNREARTALAELKGENDDQ